jgi:hypothetical protein
MSRYRQTNNQYAQVPAICQSTSSGQWTLTNATRQSQVTPQRGLTPNQPPNQKGFYFMLTQQPKQDIQMSYGDFEFKLQFCNDQWVTLARRIGFPSDEWAFVWIFGKTEFHAVLEACKWASVAPWHKSSNKWTRIIWFDDLDTYIAVEAFNDAGAFYYAAANKQINPLNYFDSEVAE